MTEQHGHDDLQQRPPAQRIRDARNGGSQFGRWASITYTRMVFKAAFALGQIRAGRHGSRPL